MAVLIGYFLVLSLIGWKSRSRERNAEDMLIGNRQIPWWAVLLSVLGTEISALTFVGVPAFAYSGNWTYLQVTLGAIGGRYLVSRYFVPAYYRHGVVSIYQFLLLRYGPWTRNCAVLVFLYTRLMMSGVRLYAGSLVLQAAFGISATHAVAVLATIGLVFCATGGIRAVVWTEVVQVAVMFFGALCALVYLWVQLPAGQTLPPEATQVFDFRLDPTQEFCLLAAVLGTTLTNTAIFGTDYDMVQRMLTARDGKQSARAVLGSGLAEIPITLLFLSIGTLLRAYYQSHPDPQLPGSAKEVFGHFIVTQLPAGLVGLLIAAVISVVLSTYESALTALAGSFVVDFYRPTLRPGRSDLHYLRVTRWATLGFALLLALVAYRSQRVESILQFGLEIGTYTYGSLLAVFAVALARSEGQRAGNDRWTALLAIPMSILAVLWVKTHTRLAFPWFVSLGALVGVLVILLTMSARQHFKTDLATTR